MRFERQQLGIIIAVIAMTAVFAVLQYLPLRSRAHAMEQVKAAQVSAGSMTETQIKSLPALRTQLGQMQTKVGNYEAKIPDERALGAFLQEIADVMNKHNLTDQLVQPENEIKIDNIMCIPVRMQCSGTFRQIFEFFESLEKLERLIRIEQVQLKNDRDLSGLVTMVAKADIYYRISGSQTRGQ